MCELEHSSSPGGRGLRSREGALESLFGGPGSDFAQGARVTAYRFSLLPWSLSFWAASVPVALAKRPQIYITGKDAVGTRDPVGALDPGLEPYRYSPLAHPRHPQLQRTVTSGQYTSPTTIFQFNPVSPPSTFSPHNCPRAHPLASPLSL